jgi:GTP:adenosylcobinamide-phosphate guanylyltransferase
MTTALVLAGKRDGALDPLAVAARVEHKCVAPVAGRPMIAHVLEALSAAQAIDQVLISIDDPPALNRVPQVREGVAAGRIRVTRARTNLVDSVISALQGASFPVLITTADNVLLDPASVARIEAEALARKADVVVAFARKADVLAAHPDGQRRFYAFREDAYSNCNAYWIGSAKALAAAEVFRQGGQFAKHPGRIIQAFGLTNLIRFRLGWGTLEGVFRGLSRRFRLKLAPVVLENGAVAIDVDNARTLGVAEEVLSARQPPEPARASA